MLLFSVLTTTNLMAQDLKEKDVLKTVKNAFVPFCIRILAPKNFI
jgi:hypothetical protein